MEDSAPIPASMAHPPGPTPRPPGQTAGADTHLPAPAAQPDPKQEPLMLGFLSFFTPIVIIGAVICLVGGLATDSDLQKVVFWNLTALLALAAFIMFVLKTIIGLLWRIAMATEELNSKTPKG